MMNKKAFKELEMKLSNNWAALAVPGRLEAGCAPPFSLETSFYYDGGSIRLSVERTELICIERDVEFSRIDITIPESLQERAAKIIGIMDQLADRAIERGVEEADLARKAQADKVFDILDALPDRVDARATKWAIAPIGHIGEGFKAGPFNTLEEVVDLVGADIAVEIDGRGSKPLRGFTMRDGVMTWHDADACLRLRPDEPGGSDTPEPGW